MEVVTRPMKPSSSEMAVRLHLQDVVDSMRKIGSFAVRAQEEAAFFLNCSVGRVEWVVLNVTRALN